MFETQSRSSSRLWKILPVAAIIFVAIVGILVFLSRQRQIESEELEGVLHAGDPSFDWYQKYVTLRDPKVEMGLNFAGKRIVMCAGVIENGGEKALDVVQVRLVFFNSGRPVYEMIRSPIRPGPYTPPVPSLADRGFTLYVEEIPEDWNASAAEMSLYGFRFKEE